MATEVSERKGTVEGVEPAALAEAIQRAQNYLLRRQNPAGYWVGELEADASVSAGYVPLMYFMLGAVDAGRQRKVVRFIQSQQRADGSWSSFYGGPGDLNVSIQAYFALKLAGVSAEEPAMRRARDFILAKGGITKANVFTKIWLAIFGQYDWRGVPSVPPEVIFLPPGFYFNIYEFASWSRETIMALAIVLTLKPVCRVPEQAQVSELYVEPEGRRGYSVGRIERLFTWRSFFLLLDRLFKLWELLPYQPGRRAALQRTAQWIEAHQEADGSWGGIMLPWVYSLIALRSLGYSLDHPVIAHGLQGLEGFLIEDEETLRLQPATSPVWDTAWAMLALAESGLNADHLALRRAAGWLLDQEVRTGGDWQVKNPHTEPGGWAFEFDNDFYPDIDDSAVVARALKRVQLPQGGETAKAGAIRRALRWIESMQSKDGGWAAFDRDNDKQILAHIPFADFMAPLDPTCPDVTAHVVELCGELNQHPATGKLPRSSPDVLTKALAYLASAQEADGAWYGRWGVNYIYGTGLVLAALETVGQAGGSRVQEAVAWLKAHQNSDGGWGESCQTYDNPALRGCGPSTASQTAWALLGLIAAGQGASAPVRAGIRYLLQTQQKDGSWVEDYYTGTGFPRAFYLRYDLYRIYFPLLALARYQACLEKMTT